MSAAGSPATPEHPRRPASHEGDGARPDRSAFSDLYEAHAPRVYRYLLSRTSNPSDAEELTSRTFVRALAGLDQYRGRGAGFPAWLMSIAHNLLVNWYRDRGRRPPTEALDAALQVPTSTPGPEASLEQNESIARVRAAISALAPERQQLISLKYVDGLSNAEIGRIMARTEGAVKALHHRTLRELQQLLGEEERGAPQREPERGPRRGSPGGSRR
ncbi:MAG: RNA polymerase sigma factor [Dehalococcoidia bacterium]